MIDSRIKKIVLTGGPCAGKSTILAGIQDYLVEKGYYVITLDETATQLIRSNMPPLMDRERVLIFQDIVLKTQLGKEISAIRYADELLKDEKVIILCDRAIMDNKAYLPTPGDFNFLLEQNGLNEQEVLHSYDFVIDLISTATAKGDSYELNCIRSESREEAAKLDKKTTLAWAGHPRLITVMPTDTIEEKSNIVKNEIDKFLAGVEYNNRQTITMENGNNISISPNDDCVVVDISKTYLKDDLVLTYKQSGVDDIMILGKYSTSFYDRPITKDEAIKLIYKKPIVYTEELRETSFVDNGFIYKIIENGDKCYFNYDKRVSPGQISSAVTLANKQFVKRKK